MTGHTLWNNSTEAGYESYQHSRDLQDPGYIGIGMVWQRLKVGYSNNADLFSQLASSSNALIYQNYGASNSSGHHRLTDQGGSGDFDIAILNLTLTNISDFDEQVIIYQVSQTSYSTNRYRPSGSSATAATFAATSNTASGYSAGALPDFTYGNTPMWVPRGSSIVLYSKSSPLYSPILDGHNKFMKLETVNNDDSIDVVCCYAILHQSKS